MKILGAKEMRSVDRRTIEEMRVPGLVLMENAGRRVAEALLAPGWVELPGPVLFLCGKGNNGGDGFVAARHLALAGVEPEVALVGTGAGGCAGDAAAMLAALTGIGVPVDEYPDEESLPELEDRIAGAGVLVDALLGTGLAGAARGPAARIIEAVNRSPAPVLAVDIPSGLSGDSAAIPGPAVSADLTVTFACPKLPHLLPPAEGLVGELQVVEMGIPPWAVEAEEGDLELVEEPHAASLLPEREAAAHKGDFGRVLVVAGSVGMAGAAALVARSALRVGAGLVTVAAPAAVRAEVAVLSPEALTSPLTSGASGSLDAGAAEEALALATAADVLALGPGLGRDASTAEQIRLLVEGSDLPLVLDADGLNAFGLDRAEGLDGSGRSLVLTPHPGEMGRLLGASTAEVQADRLGAVRRCAEKHRAVVVLKGHRSLVADPEGRVWINPTGNSGMATGGAGDVLTGMIAGLVAQGLPGLEAAILGVFAHGMAGDLAAETGHEAALVAGDLVEALPAVLDRLSETAGEEPLP